MSAAIFVAALVGAAVIAWIGASTEAPARPAAILPPLDAATQEHECDRAWRLDEWNRGRNHRLLVRGPLALAAAGDDRERVVELALWNGKRPPPPPPPVLDRRRD